MPKSLVSTSTLCLSTFYSFIHQTPLLNKSDTVSALGYINDGDGHGPCFYGVYGKQAKYKHFGYDR